MATDLRVLLVDDSRIFRGALQSALEELDWVRVAGSVFSGEKALAVLETTPVDLVLLDLEMPGLSGLETLKLIQRLNGSRPPLEQVGVLIVSSQPNAQTEAVKKAISYGAFGFLAKPVSTIPGMPPKVALLEGLLPFLERYRNRLERQKIGGNGSRTIPQPVRDPNTPATGLQKVPSPTPSVGSEIRPVLGPRPFTAIGLGVSTGGPRALTCLVPAITKVVNSPILIVQHMPAGFTASLAESLSKLVPDWSCTEAKPGEEVGGKMIRVAPGGRHLEVRRVGTKLVTELTDGPLDCGCRPAANVLFRSLAAQCGSRSAVMVLTGMGNDGASGALEIRKAGGLVLAQDEASSVVWGMPGSALSAGAVHEVAPLERLAIVLAEWIRRREGA
jgi:two-component system chemotaxis response regulator CheB